VRILVHREPREADGTDDDERDHHHRREDGALDGDIGEEHQRAPVAAASPPISWTCIPAPSIPTLPTTTWSPAASPSSTCTTPRPSSTTPSFTTARSSEPPCRRHTNGSAPALAAGWRIACCGTSSWLSKLDATICPVAKVLPLSAPLPLGTCTYTVTDCEAGSTVGLTRATRPSIWRASAVKRTGWPTFTSPERRAGTAAVSSRTSVRT